MRARIPQLANGKVKTRARSKKSIRFSCGLKKDLTDYMSSLHKQHYFLFSRIKELERTLDLFLIIMALT